MTYRIRGGNKARTDKDSIVVDVSDLLKVYHPVFQTLPKIERIDGAAREFRNNCYSLIHHFHVARNCQEVRLENIQQMFGDFGELMTNFGLIRDLGIVENTKLYLIAEKLSRIEEGIGRWRNSLR